MDTKESWIEYVDKILLELGYDNDPILKLLKEKHLAEYEPGISPDEFKRILENLTVGDVIIFHFKRDAKWQMNFLALFSLNTSCFEYERNQLPSYEALNYMAMGSGRFGTLYKVRCKICSVPISEHHSIDWIVRYLGISLKDVTVKKAK